MNVNIVECDKHACDAVKFPEQHGDAMKYVTGAALNDGWQKITLETLERNPGDMENDDAGVLWLCPEHRIPIAAIARQQEWDVLS